MFRIKECEERAHELSARIQANPLIKLADRRFFREKDAHFLPINKEGALPSLVAVIDDRYRHLFHRLSLLPRVMDPPLSIIAFGGRDTHTCSTMRLSGRDDRCFWCNT